MSWQTALGITYSNCADFLENGTDGLYKKMTDAGWTLHDDLVATSGQTDKVFKSVGEDGTEVIYIRITQASGTQRIKFGMYTFWDASGHAGYNEARGGLTYGGHSDWPWCCATLASSFIGWIVANKDGVSYCYKMGIRYSMGYFGTIKDRMLPVSQAGRTTLSAGATIAASGSTVLSVVSESNLQAGQKVWVINQATTSGGTMVRCTVVSTASGQVTVTNDSGTATTFDTGALLGFDPQPTVLPIGYDTDSMYHRSCPQKGFSTLYKMSDTRKTGTAQTYSSVARFSNLYPNVESIIGQTWPNNALDANQGGYFQSRMDPDYLSRFLLSPYCLIDGWTDSTTPVTESVVRGTLDRLCWIPKGSILASEDTLTIAGLTAQWMAIDTLSPGTGVGSSECIFTAMKIAE